MFTVGIDWGVYKHVAVILRAPGERVAALTFENNLEGFLHLLDGIRRYAPGAQPADVPFAIERKSLRLTEFLLANGFPGYLVDPNSMPGYRSRYTNSGAKDDERDAFVQADLLWRDRDLLEPIKPDSDVLLQLKLLLADRAGFVADQTSLINRLKVTIREFYPAALELFVEPTGKTALAFLAKYSSPADAARIDRDELKAFLLEHHCFTKPRLVKILKALCRERVPTPGAVVAAKRITLGHLVRQLQGIQEVIAGYEDELRKLTEKNPETERLDGLPGAGLIVSSTLYCLFGDDRSRHSCAADVQSYVGTAPRTIQSGKSNQASFRFACAQHERAVLTRWAFNSLREAKWARQYYTEHRARGKSHYHALRCLANVLLKIAFAMWKNRTNYSEDHYLAQVARHAMNNRTNTAMSSPQTRAASESNKKTGGLT